MSKQTPAKVTIIDGSAREIKAMTKQINIELVRVDVRGVTVHDRGPEAGTYDEFAVVVATTLADSTGRVWFRHEDTYYHPMPATVVESDAQHAIPDDVAEGLRGFLTWMMGDLREEYLG